MILRYELCVIGYKFPWPRESNDITNTKGSINEFDNGDNGFQIRIYTHRLQLIAFQRINTCTRLHLVCTRI